VAGQDFGSSHRIRLNHRRHCRDEEDVENVAAEDVAESDIVMAAGTGDQARGSSDDDRTDDEWGPAQGLGDFERGKRCDASLGPLSPDLHASSDGCFIDLMQ